MPADVRDADQVRTAVRAALEAHGGLDAVVYAAAVMAYGRIEEIPAETFSAVVESAVPTMGAYAVSKWGQRG